jgi:hypothetical protein
MPNKEILQRLDDIKRILDIINLRLDSIDNDIYSMKTWICGFDREEGGERDKTVQIGQNMNSLVQDGAIR